MRGVGVIEFGGPEVLQIVDLPEVHAAQGEVRIRVHGATVNPTDTAIRDGARAEALSKLPPPYIPGMDIAGVIDGTRAYDGCELMTMVVNQDDPSNVLFVERWETRAKYEAYLAWRTETGSMENLVGMLAGDPVIRFFDDTGV